MLFGRFWELPNWLPEASAWVRASGSAVGHLLDFSMPQVISSEQSRHKHGFRKDCHSYIASFGTVSCLLVAWHSAGLRYTLSSAQG